jgi:Holliday junction resolvase
MIIPEDLVITHKRNKKVVDSRAKGARGEYLVRDLLREHTGLQFERVPMSGALEYLKGDLYIPNQNNCYCIEVKNYADSPMSDKVLTQQKTNNLIRWWKKLLGQAHNGNQQPLLFFKYNRSKVFVCTEEEPKNLLNYVYISPLKCYVMVADEWLTSEEIRFIGSGF